MKNEHVSLWLLVFALGAGSVGITLFLLPVLLFAKVLATPLALLLGGCLGMLFTYSLRTLGLERHEHVRGALFLASGSLVLVMGSIMVLEAKLGIKAHAIFIAVPFVIGLVAPYILEKKLHGGTHGSS
jgi:hypothetical protein